MEIHRLDQYNQGISRYKLLSANAGVGSIITSAIGTYILISDINKWDFIHTSNTRIRDIRGDARWRPEDWYEVAKREIINDLGVDIVNDERFIEFLKKDKGLTELLCLAAIPHLSLDERFNTVNVNDNPIIRRLKDRGISRKDDNYTIPGTHFPKWFRNDDGRLRTYDQWKEEWRKSGKQIWFFAPPRDPHKPSISGRKVKDLAGNSIPEYRELTQLNLLLICANGHLSDIPWSHYLRWRTENPGKNDTAELFTAGKPCCDKCDLKWSESKNRSEGYGSVFLECLHCGLGSGKVGTPKINLEGINNLSPFCPGHKPWEMPLDDGQDQLPHDENCCNKIGERAQMQVALVTGNNVYFAGTFSSLFIPLQMLTGLSPEMERTLKECERSYDRLTDPKKTKAAYADRRIDLDRLDELGIVTDDREMFLAQLKTLFVDGRKAGLLDDDEDLHEQYRRQEYQVLTQHVHSFVDGLKFSDIALPATLARSFKRIKKIEELKVTSVQLDLTRVQPSERMLGPDGKVIATQGQNIFSIPEKEVYIMPAVENFGEGIFFEFNEEMIGQWMGSHEGALEERIRRLMPIDGGFNGNVLRQKIKRARAKFLLIHTFSHLMMRELEFTCGYPTASLKERLYIGPDMAGVLIYTAEGSEGSMGGLVWQAHPDRIQQLMDEALERAFDCSADPLCWECDGQGVFNLNLAACFSCALVAETACEEWNLGLDRRVLIDEGFGFFNTF